MILLVLHLYVVLQSSNVALVVLHFLKRQNFNKCFIHSQIEINLVLGISLNYLNFGHCSPHDVSNSNCGRVLCLYFTSYPWFPVFCTF